MRNFIYREYYFLIWVLLLVDGVSGDEEFEVLSVTEGGSITLNSGVTAIEEKDQLLWKFGNSVIVKVEKAEHIFKDNIDERFSGRLKVNEQNGSLTIAKVTSTHAGIYERVIKNTNNSKPRRFSVIVHVTGDEKLSVVKGDSFSLSIGVKVQGEIWIQWKFEGQVIPTDRLNGSVEDRWSNVHLNNKIGELHFRHIQINQSGNYEVKANTSSLAVHKKFLITVDSSGWDKAGPYLVSIIIVLVLVVLCICICCVQKKKGWDNLFCKRGGARRHSTGRT